MKSQSANVGEVREEGSICGSGQEDPLDGDMATCSHILAWKIPWTKEPGRLHSVVSQKSDMTERLNMSTGIFHMI